MTQIPGKGRGVVATADIPANTFICEYRCSVPPFPRHERPAKEAEHAYNKDGCYIFEVQCRDGVWLCFDATRPTKQHGRYLNHAPAPHANIRPLRPFLINGALWVGFISLKPIRAGEEPVWDYQAPDEGFDFLKRPTHSEKVGTGFDLVTAKF